METSLQIIVDRYLIQRTLQAGGMTTVYKARDLKSDELVAIKLFDKDQYLPEIEREAFRREVEALQNLSHPHIVHMLDSGEDNSGRFFVVLELMKHDLIHEHEAKGPAFAGWDSFADLVALPLLDALAYAHEMGIAHRDVKPANILVTFDGIVKLADFGISKLKRTLQPRVTLKDFMSPPFSPPEVDTSAYTYVRDVYSIGILSLWAIGSKRIAEYQDISNALKDFDAPDEIISIIEQAVSVDPAKRQHSAALLATKIRRIQIQRQRDWDKENRAYCSLGLTKRAITVAMEELDTENELTIRRFIAEDINIDSAVERSIEKYGTVHERIRPGHYMVLGSTLRYHIAKDDRGLSNFVLINIIRPEQHFLQRDKERMPLSPLTFTLDTVVGVISIEKSIEILERTIEFFEVEIKERERSDKENRLFNTWLRTLDAKVQHEQEQSKPIDFRSFSVDGTFVTLVYEGDLEGVELGQGRIIFTDDGRYIRGEVWEIQPGRIVLNCPGAPLYDMPSIGEAKLDQYALQVAVDRQRAAIDQTRGGTCTNSMLKELVLSPSFAAAPEGNIELSSTVKEMLDESKCNAINSALTSSNILLVEGPPGTGKTQFIVALIVEELRRNPKTRILLASQTHIAIDNALERLTEHKTDIPILRIAREQSTAVAECSMPFLLTHQMRSWRDEVIKRSTKGLEQWATEQGIDPNDIRIGTLIRQILSVRDRIRVTRKRVDEENDRKKELEKKKSNMSKEEFEIESERSIAELQDLRDQLDSDKKIRERLANQLKTVSEDAVELLNLSVDEQGEWAEALLGETSVEQQAERLLKLQSEWVDRFGTVKGFIRYLIQRSVVVAATCVGLSSVEEANYVDYDICVIDESSKATAMESCIPMSRAKRWVLVGDSRQLPPFQEEVLAHPDLREHYELNTFESGESMFERFRRLLPDSNRVMLTTQYRMVEPIGRLISDCFYDGMITSDRKEIDTTICGLTGYAVNWISTRKLLSHTEQPAGTSFVNSAEAGEICRLLCDIDNTIKAGGTGESYSVIVLSGYAAQVRHMERRIVQIQRNLRHLKIECCTVDRVQGRQADAVFFSVTRSNPDHTAGFLRALERINVALSRAKDLLFVVGDDAFVERAQNAQPLQRVLSHIRRWQSECYIGVLESNQGEKDVC